MEILSSSVSHLNKKDIEKAVDILSEAFMDYPFPAAVIKNVDRRRTFMREIARIEIRYSLKKGCVLTLGGEFREVSVWHDSAKQPSYLSYFSSLSLSSLRLLFCASSEEYKAINYSANELYTTKKQLNIPENTAELSIIGVHPDNHGEGRAARLIRPVLAELAAKGQNCIVVTNTEKNKTIYQKMGFETLSDKTDERGVRMIILFFDCGKRE